MFGLSKDQEWKSENKLLSIKSDIERIPSPFIFKVFHDNGKCRIFFWVKHYHQLPEHRYSFSVSDLESKDFLFDGLDMNSPVNFNFSEYLENAISEFNSINKLGIKTL